MNHLKKIKQGDLFLVNFNPSTGHEYQGKRPAIVIQSTTIIKKSNLITVIPLTSNTANKLADDILIKQDPQNKLFCDSILKVYNITSFDQSRFIKKIGQLNNTNLNKIKKYLKIHFNL